jgi:hypothetical protein
VWKAIKLTMKISDLNSLNAMKERQEKEKRRKEKSTYSAMMNDFDDKGNQEKVSIDGNMRDQDRKV